MTDRMATVHATADVTVPISVFVVDDHPAFLRTAAFVIDATPGFALAGTAVSGTEALDSLTVRSDINLVLLDVHLPDLSGIEVARRRAEAGGTEVVILMSTTDRADLPGDALDRGVAGFLPKELLTTQALRAVWDDANGVS
ncbi:MAG TPA: response regulator transcription factor [Ilumatobacteraceae bacterium]|nr:response regulator transcription factor [Ilumatobacteraceae bacterium]